VDETDIMLVYLQNKKKLSRREGLLKTEKYNIKKDFLKTHFFIHSYNILGT
jgi:hypothetical protein